MVDFYMNIHPCIHHLDQDAKHFQCTLQSPSCTLLLNHPPLEVTTILTSAIIRGVLPLELQKVESHGVFSLCYGPLLDIGQFIFHSKNSVQKARVTISIDTRSFLCPLLCVWCIFLKVL